jgi:serine protease DegQ
MTDMAPDAALTSISNALADIVDHSAASVVQVQGRRRPVSGVVYANEIVATPARALGREDGLQVRDGSGSVHAAELVGWDPATTLAVLRVPGLAAPALERSAAAPRVGHLAVAIARSWSNAVTASAGSVAVIGGPLATGRRRAIEQVIRTTAPMHSGFSGGAFVSTEGRAIGITTAAAIRGLGVVIPAAIAWPTIASVLQHGRPRRAYLGIAGQPVALPASQADAGRTSALLVMGITADSPAAEAGLLVGDLLLEFDGRSVVSSEDLLELLDAEHIGRPAAVRVLRGTSSVTLTVTPREHN